jgi:hypothetical protein
VKTGKTKPKTNKFFFITKKIHKKPQLQIKKKSWFLQSLSFYIFLVGAKICVAYITGKSREFVTGKTYLHIMNILGILISIFALIYLYNGFQLLFR